MLKKLFCDCNAVHSTDIFVILVNEETRSNTTYDKRSNFTHILQPIQEDASVDCGFIKLNYRAEAHVRGATRRQIDEYNAVSVKNVHESINGHIEHHVMLLGGPGEGKSIAAKEYARLVLEKKVPELRSVELVHYIEGSSLSSNREGKPFDLLFSNQLGNCITDSKLNETGERWVAKNPDKVLLIIDGLNETKRSLESPGDKISLNTSARSFIVLCNLFRGDIYKGIWILSTSRWDWVWHLPRRILPARAIELKGFSEHTTHALLKCFLPSNKHSFARNVMVRFPGLRELCAIPALLVTVAKILHKSQYYDDSVSQQEILLKILTYFKTSSHMTARNSKFLRNAMAIAYRTAKEETMEISHDKAEELHNTDMSEIEHFFIVKPDSKICDVAQAYISRFQLKYRFRCKILQEILCALYIITRDSNEFKQILKELPFGSQFNIQVLVYGIVTDEDLSKSVTTLIEKSTNFTKKRSHSLRILSSGLLSTLNDIQTIRLLYECKGVHVSNAKNPPTAIQVGKLDHPRDGHAVLSAPRYCGQIKRIEALNLYIDSNSLESMWEHSKAKYKIHHLTILGEVSDCELLRLSQLLSGNKDIKFVTFWDYQIKYNNETNEVLVESMRKVDKDVITGLLQDAPKRATVSVKVCKISRSAKKDMITPELIEDLAKHFKTEIHTMKVDGNVKTVPDVFINMVSGTSSCSVREFLLGSVNVSGKQIRSEEALCSVEEFYSSCVEKEIFKLTIHGNLFDSPLIVSIITQGQWEVITTNDFQLEYKNKEIVTVNEEYQTNDDSYYILCSLTTKLHCRSLIITGFRINFRYDDERDVKELEMRHEDDKYINVGIKQIVDHVGFPGCRKFLLSCGADTIKIGSYEIFLGRKEDKTLTIGLRHLDEQFLRVLNQLISEANISEIFVDKCQLVTSTGFENIERMALKVETRIDLLLDSSDVMRRIEMILPFCQRTSCKLARIGCNLDAIEIRDSKNIKIESTSDKRLLVILENLVKNSAYEANISVCIVKLKTSGINCERLFGRLSDENCEITIETLHTDVHIGGIIKNLHCHMDSGKLQSIHSNHHGGITLTKREEQEDFALYIQRLSVEECDVVLREFDDFRPNCIIIEEFEIGENQDAALELLARIESDELREFLLEHAMSFSHQKLAENISTMEKFCRDNSVSVKGIAVSCDLHKVIDELVLIQGRLKPNFITTSDYILNMEYLSDNQIGLTPQLRVEDGGEHKQAMQEFAEMIAATICSPAAKDEIGKEPDSRTESANYDDVAQEENTKSEYENIEINPMRAPRNDIYDIYEEVTTSVPSPSYNEWPLYSEPGYISPSMPNSISSAGNSRTPPPCEQMNEPVIPRFMPTSSFSRLLPPPIPMRVGNSQMQWPHFEIRTPVPTRPIHRQSRSSRYAYEVVDLLPGKR